MRTDKEMLQEVCAEFKKHMQLEVQLIETFSKLNAECEIESNNDVRCRRLDTAMNALEKEREEINFLARFIAKAVVAEIKI